MKLDTVTQLVRPNQPAMLGPEGPIGDIGKHSKNKFAKHSKRRQAKARQIMRRVLKSKRNDPM